MMIREAGKADAEAISGLLEQLEHPSSPKHVRRQIERIQSDNTEKAWVAVDQTGMVVGLLALQITPQFHDEPQVARVLDLCIRDTHRHQQFGRQLLMTAQAFAQNNGCCRIEVTANNFRQGAHQFYTRNGLVQTHRYFCKALPEMAGSNGRR
jgi:N-acetylglutamate synthase-like GNAT family acetyltransferase